MALQKVTQDCFPDHLSFHLLSCQQLFFNEMSASDPSHLPRINATCSVTQHSWVFISFFISFRDIKVIKKNLCLGALRVAVNTEASAANHGAPSTVTAPTRATVEPPVTAVSANTRTHTHIYIFSYKMRMFSPQHYTSGPVKPTNTEAGHRGTTSLMWMAVDPSDHSLYTAA